MKRPVRRIPDAVLQEEFPTQGKTPGWRFRITETSNDVWLIEGSDAFGRQVRRDGGDFDRLMAECEADARQINEAVRENKDR